MAAFGSPVIGGPDAGRSGSWPPLDWENKEKGGEVSHKVGDFVSHLYTRSRLYIN